MDYKILKENDSGEDVILLQQLLKIAGYFPASVTGSFGSDTKTYVTNFQTDFNIVPTGIVGEETWNKLYEIATPTTFSIIDKPTLRLGDTGEEVSEVQTVLKQLLYYEGEINGIFDETLNVAVKSFQYVNNLVPDGVVGSDTWSALIILYKPLSSCDITVTETYTVKAGDTLYSIANMFNLTVDELKNLNNLTSNTLSIGQVLNVSTQTKPEEPEEPTETYTVKAGDSLYQIAIRFDTTVDELKGLNNLTSNTLSIGQVLKVPSSKVPEEPEEPTPEQPTNTYTVVKGDSLYSIARKFNTTVDNIRKLNNLTSDILSIGQVLKIDCEIEEPSSTTLYTVKAGDTLYSIARNFNTTVSELKSLNNLTSEILSIGQVLKVPGLVQEVSYTVKAGDTLYSIAKKYNTSVDSIISKNNLTSLVLSIGQVLKI